MKLIRTYFLPVLLLSIGLLIVVGVPSLIKSPKVASLFTLIFFLIYNIIGGKIFDLSNELKIAWSLRKAWHFILGFLLGIIPIGVSYFILYSRNERPEYKGLSIVASIFILISISWEELWFRGVALELGKYRYSKIGTAIIFGLIFALLHVMNPQIDILVDGFQLFLAGYTLSVCYFAFCSIWSVLGMHFANNFIQGLFGTSVEPKIWIYPVTLFVIGLILTVRVRRQQVSVRS